MPHVLKNNPSLYLKHFCRTSLEGGVGASQSEDLLLHLLAASHVDCLQGWRQLAGFNHAFDIISKGTV